MSKKLKLTNILKEEFPQQIPGSQDPKQQQIQNQMMMMIRTTNFDDNQSVELLRTTLNQILDQHF